MIQEEMRNQAAETPKRAISAESVLSYVVIGCFVVAVLGILEGFSGGGASGGISLLASAVSLGVIAYIYCHKS
jgi:hypothetical protein